MNIGQFIFHGIFIENTPKSSKVKFVNRQSFTQCEDKKISTVYAENFGAPINNAVLHAR